MVLLRKAAAWSVVAFAALVVVFFARPMYRQGEPTVAGRTAQDFPTEIGGKPGRLSDLRGKVVVLNFWATYCAPCVEEMPSLNKLQKYIESRNAVVLGVSVDEDTDAYQKFLKDQGITFLTCREPRKLSLDYGSPLIPDTYVIDRHGKIARKFYGPQQWDSPEMLAYFDAILGQS
jgi:cytochrome c biogenesis protein CcmG, thiol:disulfide interchange protein DsbE